MHMYYPQLNCASGNQIMVNKRYGLESVLLWFLLACEAEKEEREVSSLFLTPGYQKK